VHRRGSDESLIPEWVDEGRHRAEAAGLPPFSRPRAGRRRGTPRHRSVPDIVVRVDTSEIEAWTLEVVRRLEAGEQLEDRRVELKREWPTPQAGSYAKAARQLAGLANANHPEHVLWLVGLDERQRQIVGADPVETASWWTGVESCFDGDPPELADVVVTVDGRTVVALSFGTSGAPFVVKNPLHGTSGHVIATEVPWRDGTRVRTARKHELRTLLAPRLTVPEILVQNASLTLHGTTDTDSQVRPRWTGQMVWSVESLVPKRLTLPFYRMTLQLELLDHGYSAPVQLHFNDTRRLAYSDGAPDVRYVGDYIVIDGPGLIEALLASDGEAPPLPPEARGSSATVTLTMPTPGLPTPIAISAILDPVADQAEHAAPRWFLRKPTVEDG
jgi:hypothetical protein